MDIFDVLSAISKRKTEFVKKGMAKTIASNRAKLAVSKEYHIPICDIRKICGMSN